MEEPTTKEKPYEETMDTEEADPQVEEEEGAPLEDWTLKELKKECQTLGLSEKGKKLISLIELKRPELPQKNQHLLRKLQ